MPRIARTVFKNIPHHITQRGNRHEVVFYSDDDRRIYLRWLKEYTDKFRVKILAYCLMDNHIHLILQPSTEEGLHRVLKPLHMRYAQRINKQKSWKGHLWQGRFFSSAMGNEYLTACIRYIERNPVRAGIVECAEEYLWSSAAAHSGHDEAGLLSMLTYQQRPVLVNEWRIGYQREMIFKKYPF